MPTRLDFQLECSNCLTVYINLPDDLTRFTLIRCSSCGTYLGRWGELEASLRHSAASAAFLKCVLARSFGKHDLIYSMLMASPA
jgi:hypothetical protein